MLLEADRPRKPSSTCKDRLANKIKIPGFGHRVYHTDDPRATHLRAHFRGNRQDARATGSVPDVQADRRDYEGEKNLNANVDFYSASTYYSLGIPIDLFTPIFAVSRMSGWTAHILEQYHNNRLIRPRAEYTGKPRWARRGYRSRAANRQQKTDVRSYRFSAPTWTRSPAAGRLAASRSIVEAFRKLDAERRAAVTEIRATESREEQQSAGDRQAAKGRARTPPSSSSKCETWGSGSRRWTQQVKRSTKRSAG